jgi:voltage-gated potassium channel
MKIFEWPYGQAVGVLTWDNYLNSAWCVIITMTTVGYGDIVPATLFGRLTAVVAALWGTFLVSILILSVGNIFKLQNKE